MWQGRHSLGSGYSHWWTTQICGRYFTLSLWDKWWLMLASSKVLRAEMHSPTSLVNMLGAPWNFGKSIQNDLFTCKNLLSWRTVLYVLRDTSGSRVFMDYSMTDTESRICHVTGVESRRERKLDSLKSEFKGAANETPTCAVSMHAPQTSSLRRGGDEDEDVM